MNAAPDHPVNGARPFARGTAPLFDRKRLPVNDDIEASILGGVICRPEYLQQLADVESNTFHNPKHRAVWEAIRNLDAAGAPIDVVTLDHEIERVGKSEAVGGISFLGELALRIPTLENIRHYANTAITLQRNRDAIIALGSALERALGWPHEPEDLLPEIAGELQRHVEIGVERSTEQRARWCQPLDNFLGGEEPSDDDAEDWIIRDLVPRAEPVLWGGPMKGGKTWSALDLLIAVALGEPWATFENTLGEPARALGLFLEDSTRRIGKRVWELCRGRMTGSGMMTPYHERVQANLRLTRNPIRLPDPKDVRRFVTEIKNWGAKLVVIDNLTRVMVGDPNSTRDASAFTRAWCDIAEETGAAIMLLHHTKKPGGQQNGGEVDPFDTLRGSGDFGAAARNVVVVSPIRQDNGPTLAEIRMRGNLDLRRDGFVLGFERDEMLGKMRAKLTHRGEIGSVKEDVRKLHKEQKAEQKKADFAREMNTRKELAMSIARAEGAISQTRLASAVGLRSPRAVAPVLDLLCEAGLLRKDKLRGCVPVDAPTQGGLL